MANQLQWGRGLSAAETPPVWCPQESARPCFNGAAAFQPRKRERKPMSLNGVGRLQWGRGLSAAETRGPDDQQQRDLHASMGPRPFSRGNDSLGSEIIDRYEASMGPRPFSRGNDLVLGEVATEPAASMGPRPFSRGNT